ncbi:MAG: hypothetical protein DBY17_06500 [Oscillospiraceae bacterium]|nr:MAG: hypothetical protein DBY17_06500 [Oscillospiraceae bacterium]
MPSGAGVCASQAARRLPRPQPLPRGHSRRPVCFCPARYTPVFGLAFCAGQAWGQALHLRRAVPVPAPGALRPHVFRLLL